ncbi:hypothetical protein ACH5RR_006211 [Cinchona calisaya]|uniref:N-acetyltransferase domain-containing protein n=1 Tax=Cinchona calisaya TaxID=153742 RepID=A0ABD3ANE5_9GENT
MSSIALQRLILLKSSFHGIKTPYNNQRISGSWQMSANFSSSQKQKEMESSKEIQNVSVPQTSPVLAPSDSELQFDRLQTQDQMLFQENRFEFGQFVARVALLDEEYWTAAWLRAESHWEDRRNDRFADNYKRKFAEQEFNALKRRSKAQIGHKCTCIVAVKKESRDVKHTVLKSVVGTLDLSIQYLSQGETFPGERVKTLLFCSIDRKSCNKYGYISNLCVNKSARRQGVASNMLLFAITSAKRDGAEQVFVHVHRHNTPAQELYHKMGFQVVEAASYDKSMEQIYLLRLGS